MVDSKIYKEWIEKAQTDLRGAQILFKTYSEGERYC